MRTHQEVLFNGLREVTFWVNGLTGIVQNDGADVTKADMEEWEAIITDVISKLTHLKKEAARYYNGEQREEPTSEDQEVVKLRKRVGELLTMNSELISLNIWSIRRLPEAYKAFAYNNLDKITSNEHERL